MAPKMFRTPDGQYMFVRVNGDPFRVERVVDVKPADPEEHDCPDGWLLATVEAYSEERDESATVSLVTPPQEDDPTQPDFQALQRIAEED